jgi:hypothetical protein
LDKEKFGEHVKMANKRIMQLKFIANIFKMSLNEIKETLGFETLTMIFRRVGEAAAASIVERLKGKYNTIDEFCALIISNVMEPVIGESKASFNIDGNKISITLDACPYKKAGGFPITEMDFFCHYTEGLIDESLKLAFPDKTFFTEPGDLISGKCKSCTFESEMS